MCASLCVILFFSPLFLDVISCCLCLFILRCVCGGGVLLLCFDFCVHSLFSAASKILSIHTHYPRLGTYISIASCSINYTYVCVYINPMFFFINRYSRNWKTNWWFDFQKSQHRSVLPLPPSLLPSIYIYGYSLLFSFVPLPFWFVSLSCIIPKSVFAIIGYFVFAVSLAFVFFFVFFLAFVLSFFFCLCFCFCWCAFFSLFVCRCVLDSNMHFFVAVFVFVFGFVWLYRKQLLWFVATL